MTSGELMPELFVSTFALPELVEAAARTGNTELAASAVDQLAKATRPGGTNWGLGVEARCRALVSQGRAAEDLYREAIDRLGRTRLRPEPEIGARLFISAHTAQYHLSKVFAKLGITSRRQLHRVLHS
jgi:hypothetical protein